MTRWTPPCSTALHALVLISTLLFTPVARAWDEAGHRLIALVAQSQLDSPTREALQPLLGGDTLADAAVWLDEQKDVLAARRPGSRRWHYNARPLCEAEAEAEAEMPRWCRGGDCLSVQLAKHQRVLADAMAPLDDRRFALRVVLHLVADLHQPLHTASDRDGGGNDRLVQWPGVRRPVHTNLHAAWDGALLRADRRGADERALAQRWWEAVPADERLAWRRGEPVDWLRESQALARRVAYGGLPGGAYAGAACGQPVDDTRLALPDTYREAARAVMQRQQLRAGARTAELLRRSLAPR